MCLPVCAGNGLTHLLVGTDPVTAAESTSPGQPHPGVFGDPVLWGTIVLFKHFLWAAWCYVIGRLLFNLYITLLIVSGMLWRYRGSWEEGRADNGLLLCEG